MKVRTFAGERWSETSSRSFGDVVANLEKAVGHPSLPEFLQGIQAAKTMDDLEVAVRAVEGPSELIEFARFDLGIVVNKKRPESEARQSLRLLLGNPLIMKEMVRGTPDAGSYAPVTVLIDERGGGVHLSYDRIAVLLADSGDAHALQVAQELDRKVEGLLRAAAK